MVIDPIIQKKANEIRTKVYGEEVREGIAESFELVSGQVVDNSNKQFILEEKQNAIETQFQQVIDETTGKDIVSAPEIIAARGNNRNLSQRLLVMDQQISETEQKINGILSLTVFEDLKVGEDWKPAIQAAISQAVAHKKTLVFPNGEIITSLIYISDIDGLKIETSSGTVFKPVSEEGSHIIAIENSKNIEINSLNIDGLNRRNVGFSILSGNENIHIGKISVRNIAPPINVSNPKKVGSYGIFIASNANNNIFINNVFVDNVKNNDNGIIGDEIGSSRGLGFDISGTNIIPCQNIVIKNVTLINIDSEDADALDFKGLKGSDIRIHDIFINNSKRRAVKFQGISGVKLYQVIVRQTDRTSPMNAGVSFLTQGNHIYGLDVDIRAVKIIEVHPNNNSQEAIVVSDYNLKMTDEDIINGSKTTPIDLITSSDKVFINNLKFESGYIKSKNGMIVRGYINGLNIEGYNFEGYSGSSVGISFNQPIGKHAEVLTPEFRDIYIDGVITPSTPLYALNSVMFKNVKIGTVSSKDGATVLDGLSYVKGIEYTPRTFYSRGVPNNGYYKKSDYVKNADVKREYDSALSSWKVVKGWLRITDGSAHTVGTDWLIDMMLVN